MGQNPSKVGGKIRTFVFLWATSGQVPTQLPVSSIICSHYNMWNLEHLTLVILPIAHPVKIT